MIQSGGNATLINSTINTHVIKNIVTYHLEKFGPQYKQNKKSKLRVCNAYIVGNTKIQNDKHNTTAYQ